jgi:hypothetical protein
MDIQLLTKAIEKAINQNDIDFLLEMLLKDDKTFDIVLEKICSNYSNLALRDRNLSLRGIYEFLYSIIEFRKGNYERARYFANLSYSKGFKKPANIILVLIDINEALRLNKELAQNKFISIVSKILDDIVLLEYALLTFYNNFDRFSLFNLIYILKTIFHKNENIFILELYFLKEIDNMDYKEILKILLNNLNKYENKQYILEIFYELFKEDNSLLENIDENLKDLENINIREYEYLIKLRDMLKKYDIF